ncbi:hypothetical protein N9K75_00085 [bacterium]|nr:hypothetical protein [bacterium]
MTKHNRRRSTKSQSRRRRTQKRVYRGGNGNYSSAATYGSYVNGGTNSQFDRVFNSPSQSASSIGAQGQNANMSAGVPNETNLALAQGGGRRRKNHSRRNKRGGVLGPIINQAIVPFGILAMQQRYKRKSNKSSNYRKR